MLAVNSYTCVAEFTQYAAVEALKDREGATPRMVAVEVSDGVTAEIKTIVTPES